jgi:4-amino-4-deoxy-L-arabinose transferase-like glycosyltransferase
MTSNFRASQAIADTELRRLLRSVAFRPRVGFIALALLCCALYLPGIATLPVTDRDEARFAQASKQMLESGDYIDIRFQEAPRYKKPIGIYWLQSASVGLARDFGAALTDIWAYRIPSFLAALGAVLLTFWAGRPLLGREAALIASVLFASCLSLAFEARIAKSDAALICSIVLTQGALFRLYLARDGNRTRGLAALFWLGLGASILIKGPVGPALGLLTAGAVVIRDRSREWLGRLRWRWGVPLLLFITLPWFIAIGITSHGAFFAHSLGHDFAGKLEGGQESHWGPPGLYFILFWWTFWPAALFVTTGTALILWRARNCRRVLFLLSWVLPFWLLIEAIPTKLPHYALPLYPAIAMLAGFALSSPLFEAAERKTRYRPAAVLWAVVAAIQIAALIGLCWLFAAPWNAALLLAIGGFAVLAAAAVTAAWNGKYHLALAASVLSAVCFYPATFRLALPVLRPVWISEAAASAATALAACGREPVAFAGYSEPSAVFLEGTPTALSTPEDVGRRLAEGRSSLAFVASRRVPAFATTFKKAAGSEPISLGCIDGVDINGHGPTRLEIFTRPANVDHPACGPRPELQCVGADALRWRRLFDVRF